MIVPDQKNSSYHLFDTLELSKIYDKLVRPIIIAENLRTPENMGATLRIAANIGAEKVIFISDFAQNFKENKIFRTASDAAEKMNWEITSQKTIPPNLLDYNIIAIETSPDAANIFEFQFPEKVVFMIGNEINGTSDLLLSQAHHKIFIPIPGTISSINVSHALAVAAFEWFRQMTLKFR